MKLNECIKSLRLENNLSQEQLAKKLFTSQDTISLWELGKSTPDAYMIIKMSILFDVTTDYLLCVDDYKKNLTELFKK